MKNYEVLTNITLPVSFEMESISRETIEAEAQQKLYKMIEEANVQLKTVDGEIISPDTVHNHYIKITEIFNEDGEFF